MNHGSFMPKLYLIAATATIAALSFTSSARGQAKPAAPAAKPIQYDLSKTLAQMDAASAKFQSTQADVREDDFTRVLHTTDTEHGTIYFQCVKGSTQMGMKITDSGQQKVVQYRNGVLDVFSPGTDQIEEFHQAQAEAYLALGFGGRGSDLAKLWNITDQGTENISVDGKNVPTEKLDLVSKDPNIVKSYFTHITIWIDAARDIALKQIFFEPGGNTRTSTYSNIRYNASKVDTAPFAIKRDSKTKVMQH